MDRHTAKEETDGHTDRRKDRYTKGQKKYRQTDRKKGYWTLINTIN